MNCRNFIKAIILVTLLPIAICAQSILDGKQIEQQIEGNGYFIELYVERWNLSSTGMSIYKFSNSPVKDQRDLLYRIRGWYEGHISLLSDSLLLVNVGPPTIIPLHSESFEPFEMRVEYHSPKPSQLFETVNDIHYNVELYEDIGGIDSKTTILRIRNDSINTDFSTVLLLGVNDLRVQFLDRKLIAIDVEWESIEKRDTIFVYWEGWFYKGHTHISLTPPSQGLQERKSESGSKKLEEE